MKHTFSHLGKSYTLDIGPGSSDFTVRFEDDETRVALRDLGDGAYEIRLDNRTAVVHVAGDGDRRWVAYGGRIYELERQNNTRRSGRDDVPEGVLRAPMPGQVRAVNIAAGDPVQKGDTLMILEAMKMEIRIQSPLDGKVVAIKARVWEQVERDQVLIEIE